MKAKHIVLGVAVIGVGALAAVSYTFESNKSPDLCSHPEKFTYSDFVRQVETRFTAKQMFDAEVKSTQEGGRTANLTCMKIDTPNEDGTHDYLFSADESMRLRLRTGKSKSTGKFLVGIVKIANNVGQEFNPQFTMSYLDLLPKKMAEMESK